MKHVILDFDGVIADTFDFHRDEIRGMYGIELFPEEYREMHDGNFYNHTNEKLLGIDLTSYAKSVAGRQALATPFPGAIETIRRFSQEYAVHLVTSGWDVQVRPFLKIHGIESCFQTLMFADESKSKHEKLERILEKYMDATTTDYIFVTDTVGDVRSHMSGIPTLAVTFGFHDKERLQKANPEFIVDTWKELEVVINNQFQF